MIYTDGKNTTPGRQTDLKNLIPGKEYVFDYQSRPIDYAFISPSQMKEIIKGLLEMRKALDTQDSSPVLDLSGIQINTGNGAILLRGSVSPSSAVTKVNPWAVAAAIGSIFAAIHVGVSLLYVYDVLTDGSAS